MSERGPKHVDFSATLRKVPKIYMFWLLLAHFGDFVNIKKFGTVTRVISNKFF